MKIIFDERFHAVYTSDPAAAAGRMEAIVQSLPTDAEIITPPPATEEQILLAHTKSHVRSVRNQGLYDIAALAAGGAIETARIGLSEPAFGIIRPPGHHASADSAWGFCFFNNIAVALLALRNEKRFETALVLDVDLHFGDGTVNILGNRDWVSVYNIARDSRREYMGEVERILSHAEADIIAVSAGFDNHRLDWGGLLATEDYHAIGRMVRQTATACGGGCFALLEGGYNHSVLGQNVTAMINGLSSDG